MGQSDRDPYQSLFVDLSEEFGSSWRDIGRRLGLGEPALENIESDFSSQKERGYQVLVKWRQVTGVQDLPGRLEEGLKKAHRVDLVDIFIPKFRALSLQYEPQIVVASSLPLQCAPQILVTPTAATPVQHELEKTFVPLLQKMYKRRKIPLVPWNGANGKIVTVNLQSVYTHLELLVDIDSPDLPIRYPLKLDQLFDDVKSEVSRDSGDEDEDEERLELSSTRVVARGRTGSGKTTFLLKLSSDWADGRKGPLKGAKVVFLLLLKRLDHTSNLGDAIVDQLSPKTTFTPAFIEKYIEENQKDVAVLLDGYDEFKGKGLNQKNCGNIVKMLRYEYLPDVRVLITTRPGRVTDFIELGDEITEEYRHLEITGFSSSDIDNYINKILKDRPKLATKLLNYLAENHLKTELASLPLMCCAFCQLTKFTDGKDFKDMNTISALFDKLIKCLMKYHPKSKDQRHLQQENGDSFSKHHNGNAEAHSQTVHQHGDVTPEADELLLELGRVGLLGFLRSEEEELIFMKRDFKDCKAGADEIITRGCKVGIITRDGEAEYKPERYEDLEINNEGGDDYAHSISFVLKIFQEKLAGIYLAHLAVGSEKEKQLFETYVYSIQSIQRAIDLGNVLMFACGASLVAARVLIDRVVHLLSSEADNVVLFMEGKLHYSECQRLQRLIEFCLQLNYESQSKGALNDVLKPMMSECTRLRLVGISSYVTKSLGYFLQYSQGLSIKSLELIRLYLNSSTEFREFLNTFPGLESDVSTSIHKKRRKKKRAKDDIPLTEERRKEMLRKEVENSSEKSVPKYLLQRNDDTFMAVLPLWDNVSKMQMSEWNFGPVIEGLRNCPLEELILNGVKSEQEEDWQKLFEHLSSSASSTMERLTLGMTALNEDLMAKIVPALSTMTNLRYLKLSGNEVGAEFLNDIEDGPPMEHLETLILDKTDMDPESIHQLGGLLEKFPALRSLDIRRNEGSTDTSIGNILTNIHHCRNLECLMISLHEVTEKGLTIFQDNLKFLACLKELHLVHTPVPDTVLKCVATILPQMSYLQDLRISATPPDKTKNQLTYGKVAHETVIQFADSVAQNPSLRFVSLLYASLKGESFIYLLGKCTEATRAGLKTLRFSGACVPKDESVWVPLRAAEKTFLRIWV